MTPAPFPDMTHETAAPSHAPTAVSSHEILSDAEAPTLPAPDPPGKRIAFLVIHGIGQQRPYETLDQFGRGLLECFESEKSANWGIFPQLDICKDPEHMQKDWVRASYRLEPDRLVAFCSNSHNRADFIQEISLFEYYWAPITQDKITYSGSLLFLIKAGFQPFLYFVSNINAILKTPNGATTKLAGARALGVSILGVITRELIRQFFLFLPLILLLCGTLLWLSGLHAKTIIGEIENPSSALVLTVVFLFIRYLYAYTSAKALWESVKAKSGWQSSIFWRGGLLALFLFNVVIYPLTLSWFLRLVAQVGSSLNALLNCRWLPAHVGHWSNALRDTAEITARSYAGVHTWYWFFLLTPCLSRYVSILVWLFLAAAVRYVLVDYVGDVAVYVNASELARNFAARSQILDECTAALTNILKQRIDPTDAASARAHDQVYVAGHSLGSVIAYDTINLLLDRARTADPDPAMVQSTDLERLRGMVTFGSPLNKIFYFFRERTDPRAVLRNQTLDLLRGFRVLEGLKESVGSCFNFQPVTNPDWQNAEYHLSHNFRWINAYSVEDPISGRLVFYDLDGEPNQQAFTYPPLIAHLWYWTDPEFYTFVRQRLL